jgi:hypothetical protein
MCDKLNLSWNMDVTLVAVGELPTNSSSNSP